MEDEYKKLQDAAGEELARIHGGERGYIQWLGQHSPFWTRLISYMMIEVGRGAESELPLSVYKALLDTFLALNRQAFSMWKERDWFEVRSKPLPPGPAN